MKQHARDALSFSSFIVHHSSFRSLVLSPQHPALTMAKDLAIILSNGSVNSCAATAMAVQKYRPVLVHVEIPQPSAARARAAYDQQVAHFKPYREHTLPMPFFSGMSTLAAQNAAAA